MINEAVYCPRLFWIEHVSREFEHSYDTLDGERVHKNVTEPAKAAGAERDWSSFEGRIRAVSLSSEQLGITGILDVVDFEGDVVVPVDYKRGRIPNTPGGVYEPEQVQLCLQVLLLREAGFRADRGVIYYASAKHRVEVLIDDELVARTIAAIDEARAIADQTVPPPPLVDSPKCPRCSLVSICLPDETNRLRGRQPADVRPLVPRGEDGFPLYVVEPGAAVGKSGEELHVRKDGKLLASARLVETSHVAVFGNAQVSTQALRELASRGIPVQYLSSGGWLYAEATSPADHALETRVAQFARHRDPVVRLDLGRSFVEGKIRNQRTLVRRSLGAYEAKRELAELALLIERSANAASIDQLLGFEGRAARVYFTCLSRMFRESTGLLFENRNRRPPKDPVNAVLSFLYALLVREAAAALRAVGLEPGLGFFHERRPGRPGLALDLIEEFRPLIADSTALSLINTQEITPKHFVCALDSVALDSNGRRRVIGAFERRMAHVISHPIFGYPISYRRTMYVQARLLSRYMLGDIERYPAMVTR